MKSFSRLRCEQLTVTVGWENFSCQKFYQIKTFLENEKKVVQKPLNLKKLQIYNKVNYVRIRLLSIKTKVK